MKRKFLEEQRKNISRKKQILPVLLEKKSQLQILKEKQTLATQADDFLLAASLDNGILRLISALFVGLPFLIFSFV